MSITITSSDVTNVAPEFASESSERVGIFIEYARLFVSESKYGDRAKFAIILYTAHLLTLSNREGSGGAITAEKVGDLQRSYSTTPKAEDYDLSQTSYGGMVLQLRKTLLVTPFMVG